MFASIHTSTFALDRVKARGGAGPLARLRAALELTAQRRQLARLDDVQLADIGLTRAQAHAEGARGLIDALFHPVGMRAIR